MARPTKLTPALQKRICDDIARGVSQEAAAGMAGIHGSTLYDWLAWGKAGKKPFAEFTEAHARARAECEAELLKYVHRHAITDWRACAWLLSKKWPDRYGDLTRLELRFSAMSDAELDRWIEDAKRQIEEENQC